jgi:hypothetical protein
MSYEDDDRPSRPFIVHFVYSKYTPHEWDVVGDTADRVQERRGPFEFLDDAAEAMKGTGWKQWVDDFIESKPVNRKGFVFQTEARVEHADGSPIGYSDRKRLSRMLRIKAPEKPW